MTREQKIEALTVIANRDGGIAAREAIAQGVSPHYLAVATAEVFREDGPRRTRSDAEWLQFADELERGDFDTVIAGLLGYA